MISGTKFNFPANRHLLYKFLAVPVAVFLLSGCAAPYRADTRHTHYRDFSEALAVKMENHIPYGRPLDLETCVKIALENNLNIRLAEIDSRLARIDRNAAFSYFLPQIDITVTRLDHNRQQMQKAGDTYMAGSDKAITQKVISGQMALFYPATWFIYNSYRKGYDIQDLVMERTRQAIRLQITSLYLAVLSLESSERALEVSVEQTRALLKEVEAFYREGVILKSGLEDARLLYQMQINNLRETQRLTSSTKADLLEAMGLSPLADITLADAPSFDMAEEELSEQILKAMLNRLELNISDRNVSIRKDAVKIAIADFLPMIGIFADYTNSSNSFQLYESILSYGISGVLTVFDGFKNVQEYRAAKQEHEKAMAEREQSCMKIMLEVIKAGDFLEQAKDSKKLASMELKAAESNLKEVKALWREGMVTSSEKLDAAGRQAYAEANLNMADYQYMVAVATMKDVTGLSGKEMSGEK